MDLRNAYLETIRDFQIALSACAWYELSLQDYYHKQIEIFEEKLRLLGD